MPYPIEIRQKAKKLYLAGWSCREISRDMGMAPPTVWAWAKAEEWPKERIERGQSRVAIEGQLDKLAHGTMTESKTRKIAMLTKALARLERVTAARKRREVQKPKVAAVVAGDLKDKFAGYEANALRAYQREFTQDDSRFRSVLKGRQIGFSWVAAYDMVKNAITRNVDQNLVSTSLYQTENTIRYAREHMKALGIAEQGRGAKQEIVLFNGKYIRTLPANQATSQGWPGDVYYDEMAWYRHGKAVWEAITPSVTAVGGRITALSTPYEAGPHNWFWVIATNDGDQYPKFSRTTVTIDDAIAAGLTIDLEELAGLFDADTFARLYRCKYFTDDDSFFTLAELNECRGDCMGRWVGDDRRAGWDMAKLVDASELVGVEKLMDQVFIRAVETWRRLSYKLQRERLVAAIKRWRVAAIHIDETGVGTAVRDFVSPEIPAGTAQHWHTFTQAFKADLATNIKKLVEEGRLVIPDDDRVLISQFLNIKRKPTATGISYDTGRNASGHGDRFWALALAVSGVEFGGGDVRAELW
jgi:phage FluMu gp28-like protein